MARNNHIVNSFIAGEASPKFFGRSETVQYQQAVEKALNMVIYPQGGAGRRPGTEFAYDIRHPDGTTPAQAACIPFKASDGGRYQIIITSDAPDISSGQYPWKVYSVSTGTVIGYVRPDYNAIWTGYYDLASKGIDLRELQFAQTGDTLVIVHPKIRPMIILGGSTIFQMFRWGDAWATSSISVSGYASMPYQTRVAGVAGPLWQVTSLGGGLYNLVMTGSPTFDLDSSWVGMQMKFSASSNTLAVTVEQVLSTTTLRARTTGGVLSASPTTFGSTVGTSYEYASWNEIAGWPRTVAFFEQKSIFGGNKTFPDSLWLSETSDIYNMMQRLLEQDPDFADPFTAAGPFESTLKSETLTKINWISVGKRLTVGTNEREFIVEIDASSPVTTSEAETPHGSAYTPAARIENTAAFLQRDRRTMRELVYSNEEDSFKAPNLSIIGEHVANKFNLDGQCDDFADVKGKFVRLAMQQTPNGILWALDNNGDFAGLTRDRDQEVAAWHRHRLGGTSLLTDGTNKTYTPKVQFLSVLSNPLTPDTSEIQSDEEIDTLYMVVARGVKDGSSYVKRLFLERMSEDWDRATIEDDWSLTYPKRAPIYMDCAMVVDQTSFVSGVISNLPHGAGSVLGVVINGIWAGEFTVSETNTLDISSRLYGATTYQVILGFNYIGDLVPVLSEVPANLGSSQGQERSIDTVTIHFYRSIGCKFGRVAGNTDDKNTPITDSEEIVFKQGVNQTDPRPLYTGEKRVQFPAAYETRPRVLVRSHLPFPCIVTHIVTRLVVHEGP